MKNTLLLLFALFVFAGLNAQFQTKIGIGPSFNFPKSDARIFQSEATVSYFAEVGAVHRTKLVNLHLTMQWHQISYLVGLAQPNISSSGDLEFRNDYAVLNPSVEFKLLKQLGISVGGYSAYSFNEMIKINGTWQRGAFGGQMIKELDYGLSLIHI